MSQLKPKQLKLASAGSLLVGGNGGQGTSLAATGKEDKVLRVVSGAPSWSQNDNLKSENTFNTIQATDSLGVKIAVENEDGSGSVDLVTFKGGNPTDENLEVTTATGKIEIAAKGTAGDIDIVLTPQGDGEVVIGTAGGAILQAEDDDDLGLFGGSGSGNVFIVGGATGKVYYAEDDQDATKEVATVGYVSTVVAGASAAQTRSQFTGAQTITLATGTIANSIIVHLNGLTLKDSLYNYNGTTREITVDTPTLGYTLDASDEIVVTYETLGA